MDTIVERSTTPLRAATIWCIELRPGRPVPVGALAIIAEVDPSRAKAYASILIARGALVETGPGLVPGPDWDAWRSEPGGRPKCAQSTAAQDMDAMRRAMAANVRTMAKERGWSQYELARRSGVASTYINRLFTRAEPLPALSCVLVARTLGTTVEQLVQRTASFR